MRLPSHTCRVFTKDGTVKHLPTYKRPRRGVLIAVQHRSVWTMSPSVSTKIFSLVLLLAASATASPVEERGFFRWALLTGSWLSLNPVFWFRLQCLCVNFSHVFLRTSNHLTKNLYFIQASVLLHLPSRQLCLHHQLHLWRILLVDDKIFWRKSHHIIQYPINSQAECLQSNHRRTTLTCAQIFPVLSANSSGRSLQPNEAPVEKPQERGFFRLVGFLRFASISHFSFDCLSSADCFELSNIKHLQSRNFGKIGVLNILIEIQISPFAGLPAMAPALLLASHPQPAALSEDSSGGKLSEFAEIPKLISRRRTTLTCAQIFPVLAANQGWTLCS